MPSAKALAWGTRVIALCLLVQISLTWPLWWGPRSYPLLPTLDLPSALSSLALIGLLLALLGLLRWPRRRELFLGLAVSFLLLLLSDLTRLQVWTYHLSGLLVLLGWYAPQKPDRGLAAVRWVFPLIYWWGGLHKINPHYASISFDWLLSAYDWTAQWRGQSGLVVASVAVELLIGLGLYFRRSRRAAALLGIALHLTLLLLLGPTGHDWNPVVWPWNVLMILLRYGWYYHPPDFKLPRTLLRHPPLLLLLLLWGLLPGANRLDYWDDPLSFKLYAGDHPEALLYFAPSDTACFSPRTMPKTHLLYIDSLGLTQRYLPIGAWAMDELGVAAYNSPAGLRAVARRYCECLERPNRAGVDLIEVRTWRRELVERTYSCRDLRRGLGY